MLDTIAQNLLDPAILFFALGTVVGLLRSNLEVPAAIAKFLALYLLMALGLKGGASLAKDGLPIEGALALAASLFMAAAVPARLPQQRLRTPAPLGGHCLRCRSARFCARR